MNIFTLSCFQFCDLSSQKKTYQKTETENSCGLEIYPSISKRFYEAFE